MKKLSLILTILIYSIGTQAQVKMGATRFAEIVKNDKEFKAKASKSVKTFVATQGESRLHPSDYRIAAVNNCSLHLVADTWQLKSIR